LQFVTVWFTIIMCLGRRPQGVPKTDRLPIPGLFFITL
jgi:hypothetical protein